MINLPLQSTKITLQQHDHPTTRSSNNGHLQGLAHKEKASVCGGFGGEGMSRCFGLAQSLVQDLCGVAVEESEAVKACGANHPVFGTQITCWN
jgi:hypothetical protein